MRHCCRTSFTQHEIKSVIGVGLWTCFNSTALHQSITNNFTGKLAHLKDFIRKPPILAGNLLKMLVTIISTVLTSFVEELFYTAFVFITSLVILLKGCIWHSVEGIQPLTKSCPSLILAGYHHIKKRTPEVKVMIILLNFITVTGLHSANFCC